MKLHSVLFKGTGFDLHCASGEKIGGFFVSVLVVADSPEQAFQLAYEKLTDSEAFLALLADHDHPDGMIEVESHTILEQGDDEGAAEISGFVFYPEEAAPDRPH
jgi:hypothetical protein